MKQRYFVWAVLWAALGTAIALPGRAAVLISEVLYDSPGGLDTTLEWVELYNSGCEAVDLSSYTLQDNQGTIGLSGTIQPAAYFTFAREADAFMTQYGVAPNLTGMTHALGNSGDFLILRDGDTEVDTVAWEGRLEGWSIAAVDVTIYRLDNTRPATNANWAVSDADTPGTGPLTQDCSGESSSASSSSTAQSSSSTSSSSSVQNSSLSNSSANSSSSTSIPDYSYDTYYAGTAGLEGFQLRYALHDIIKTGHIRLTYAQVWTALQYADEDPDNTANVILLYTGRSADKNDRDGQAGFDNDSWNREHVWARSYGFPDEHQYAYTDIHHLRPTDKTVNSSRSNKAFDNGGNPQGEAADTFTDSDSWEPRDSVKGDIARMLFYMDVRYEGTDGNTPDLVLVDNTDMVSGDPNIGKLCTLIEWHAQDPVDSFEVRRNNRLYEYQGNRNPFIDNPNWVNSVWDGVCEEAASSSSSSSTDSSNSSSSSDESASSESSASTSTVASSASSSSDVSSASSSAVNSSTATSASSSSSRGSSGGGSWDWLGVLLLIGLAYWRRQAV